MFQLVFSGHDTTNPIYVADPRFVCKSWFEYAHESCMLANGLCSRARPHMLLSVWSLILYVVLTSPREAGTPSPKAQAAGKDSRGRRGCYGGIWK